MAVSLVKSIEYNFHRSGCKLIKMITITCSILCYNYGRYLSQAIDSCLNQNPGDYQLEVLVIDDGSTDETPEICQSYGDRIRVVRSENQGFGATLTRCIQEASGDYVCLLDADDYFSENKLISLLPAIQQGYLFIENFQYHVNPSGKRLNDKAHGGSSTSTICVQRSAALTLLPVGNNEIFFHPLKSAGHGIVLQEPLTCYRVHDKSMTNYRKLGAQHQYLAEVTHQLADKLLDLSQKDECNWANGEMLAKISWEYRAVAYYDEMEAALELRERGKVLVKGYQLLTSAFQSRIGVTSWHLKVLIRGILGRPLYLYAKKS